MRRLGANYCADWLLHNKIMRAISEREGPCILRGLVLLDDAYLVEKSVAVRLVVDLRTRFRSLWQSRLMRLAPQYVKLASVATFSFTAIADWAQDALATGCEVISEGLACFRAVGKGSCFHQPVVVRGRHPDELPDLRWINTVLSKLKTSISGTVHALSFKNTATSIWVPLVYALVVDLIC